MPHILEVNLCLNFRKYSLLVLKKEALFDESLGGAMPCAFYLCRDLSYHVNCCRNYWCRMLSLQVFQPFLALFYFIFISAGLRSHIQWSWLLQTCSDQWCPYYGKKKSNGQRCVPSSSTVPSFNFCRCPYLGWFFNQSLLFPTFD